jgi:hypothetical protein
MIKIQIKAFSILMTHHNSKIEAISHDAYKYFCAYINHENEELQVLASQALLHLC